MRAAATRKKEEERKAKGKEGASSSASKAVSKGLAKRKGDGKDDHPSKKATITLGDAPHKKKSPPKPSGDVGKGLMTSTGPVIEGSCRLLTHKDYAVKEVKSLIKSTDVEPCAELGMKKLGALALFYLTQVSLLSWLIWFRLFPFIDWRLYLFQSLVRVKAIQDWYVAKEGVVTQVGKHNTNLMNKQKQYKDAVHILNGELKETRDKLEEVGHQKEKLQEELMTLRGQVEKAGADVVLEFKALQSFINSYAEYYGTGFEDYLKQVASAYPDLDLSGITMDDPMSMTLAGNTIVDESDDPTGLDPFPKDDGFVLAQPTANPPVSSSNPSIELLKIEDPHAQDKDAETLNDASAA